MRELDDESLDAIITDPPYGILIGHKHHKIETDVDIPRFFNECYRVLKPNSFIVYFGQQPTRVPRFTRAVPTLILKPIYAYPEPTIEPTRSTKGNNYE